MASNQDRMSFTGITISQSLALVGAGKDGYRSQSLWLPCGARGVFGGQVIGQALVAAGETVSSGLQLHSQHCYFLLAAQADADITYQVERLRDGRSYATRAVKALQGSKVVFVLISSFTAPSLSHSQPHYQSPYPTDVLPPSECVLEEDRWTALMERYRGKWNERRCAAVQGYIQERRDSPIAIAVALRKISTQTAKDSNVRMLWLKIRVQEGENLDERMTKAAIAYLTDFQFIGTAARAAGLTRMSEPKLSMLASLDHSTHFYPPSSNPSAWLLHVMDSPLVSIDAGRGVVRGLLYTENGQLVAVTSQEGVVRAQRGRKEADARGLVEGGGAEEGDEEHEAVKAKL